MIHSGIRNLCRKVILQDIIHSINPDKYKILVIDETALSIISVNVKMSELLEGHITVVQSLEQSRQPYPTLDAIYIVSPTPKSINAIIQDFTVSSTHPKGQRYAKAHIVFLSTIKPGLFHSIKTSPAANYIQSIKEVHLDFVAMESQTFILNRPHAIRTLYSQSVPQLEQANEFIALSHKLASFCAALDEMPVLRFAGKRYKDMVATKLAHLVAQRLMEIKRDLGTFPRQPRDPPSTMLIVERSVDLKAPLLHEFTYQAMANDLLALTENGLRYEYDYDSSTGKGKETDTITMDEFEDKIWREFRHRHIAECTQQFPDLFNDFIRNNPVAASLQMKNNQRQLSITELKEALSVVPEFREQKKKYAAHISIAESCMKEFYDRKLQTLASIEQDLATGKTFDGEKVKNIERRMETMLLDEDIRDEDKIRVMQLYLLEYGVTKKNVLAANAAMDLKDSDMARGMAYLLTKGLDLRSYENSKQTKSEQNDAEQEFYELSRYTPRLKHLVRDLIQGTLDSTIFPTLSPFKKGKNNHTLAFGTSTPRSTVLSSTRPLWQTGGTLDLDDHEKLLNEEMRRNNGRFIIFVAGGITYSEIRSMYELSEELDVEVLVGSTHIITPETFLESMNVVGKDVRSALEATVFLDKDDQNSWIKTDAFSSIKSKLGSMWFSSTLNK